MVGQALLLVALVLKHSRTRQGAIEAERVQTELRPKGCGQGSAQRPACLIGEMISKP